jgi:CHAT domain-containing protein
VLRGARATVDVTHGDLNGAAIVHIAAHGEHDPDNVVFSRLHLADGPLMAFDLLRLAVPPRHVVLASCEVGRAAINPNGELLGFAAALLYAGTTSVVASVARVPDGVAAELMVPYHQELIDGASPAEALATVLTLNPHAPFVCFGAG